MMVYLWECLPNVLPCVLLCLFLWAWANKVPRFGLSSLFSQGSMFLDLLLHARAILNSKLEISYEPCEAEYWEHYMFDFEG